MTPIIKIIIIKPRNLKSHNSVNLKYRVCVHKNDHMQKDQVEENEGTRVLFAVSQNTK